ncbi:hypothetical protein BH24DEI2_BH24DEI2_18730 [soil metagenome]
MVDIERDPTFLHDEKGNKTHVLLSVDVYEELLEDLHDLAAVAELAQEDTIPFGELVDNLKRSGKL